MDRGAWRAAVHGVPKELDMTEQLNSNKEQDCYRSQLAAKQQLKSI